MGDAIDFLPPKIKHQAEFRRNLVEKSFHFGQKFILGLELLALFLLLINLGLTYTLTRQEESLQQKQDTLKSLAAAEREIRYYQAKSSAFSTVNRPSRSYSKAVMFLVNLLPKDVSFTNLNLNEQGISLSARSQTGRAFAQLVGNLLSSQRFREVILTESEFLIREKVYRFSITLPIVSEDIFK